MKTFTHITEYSDLLPLLSGLSLPVAMSQCIQTNTIFPSSELIIFLLI